MTDELTHLNPKGEARMVEVGEKDVTLRIALAEAFVTMLPDTRRRLMIGDLPKGEAIAVVRLAGIMAAKKTADLIPLCHPVALSGVDVLLEEAEDPSVLRILAEVRAVDRTGVEVEALTAVSIAALTLFDMVKAIDRTVTVNGIRVVAKSGGRSGDWTMNI